MIYIGIDPGTTGGIAWLIDKEREAGTQNMPATDRDLLDLLYTISRGPTHAVLERVWSAPGWGHVGAFKFGLNYGALKVALAATEIPFDEVLPRQWQPVMGVVYPKGKERDKNVTKRRAQQLFPSLTITHANADALLLAAFCRRIQGQQHGEEKDRRAQGRTEAREGPGTEGSEEVERFVRRGQAAQRAVGAAIARTPVAGAPRHGDGAQQKAR